MLKLFAVREDMLSRPCSVYKSLSVLQRRRLQLFPSPQVAPQLRPVLELEVPVFAGHGFAQNQRAGTATVDDPRQYRVSFFPGLELDQVPTRPQHLPRSAAAWIKSPQYRVSFFPGLELDQIPTPPALALPAPPPSPPPLPTSSPSGEGWGHPDLSELETPKAGKQAAGCIALGCLGSLIAGALLVSALGVAARRVGRPPATIISA